MRSRYSKIPICEVEVDLSQNLGPLNQMRHQFGRGGVNHVPFPDNIIEGVKKIGHNKIRVFLQEYFFPYPESGKPDWSRLDAFMESFERMGVNVVADLTIKPSVLYPTIDQSIFMPNDVKEWQELVSAMVKRYSVDKKIVTEWEILNETDIGERGVTPFLIPNPEDYYRYYKITTDAILRTCPECKVGGPAVASYDNEVLEGLLKLCSENNTQLDFVSWHMYNDDPGGFSNATRYVNDLIDRYYPNNKPEQLLTEWNLVRFGDFHYFEMTQEPRWAAFVTAAILEMMDAGLDWSYIYDIWDQYIVMDDFKKFMSEETNKYLYAWCSEEPLFLGVFGMGNEVHTPYFAYYLLSRMASTKAGVSVSIHGSTIPQLMIPNDVYTTASYDAGRATVLISNYDKESSYEKLLGVKFTGLVPGLKKMIVYRVDDERKWDKNSLDMEPVEERIFYSEDTFRPLIYSPADSVTFVELIDI